MIGQTSGVDPRVMDLILGNVADGVFAVDSDFRITLFNSAAERITGFARDEAIGRPCFEILRAQLCADGCPMRRAARMQDVLANIEVEILTSTRKRQVVSVSAAPLLDEEGTFVGGVETFREISSIEKLRRELRVQYTFDDIVANNAQMRQILAALPNLAHSNTPVLIQGGAGTGKEVIATAIHNTGCRREQPLVKVSCGILPERLLDRELFGGPDSPSAGGCIEQSRGGTLFLDEVAALPVALQARLLAVLQGLEAEGGRSSPGVDVRVIAATKHDLKAIVREGRFLEDLYLRLSVVHLLIPELRERLEDLPHLVDHFIARLSTRSGRNVHGITDGALAALRRYPFPCNIRELVNAIEHAFTVAAGGRICTDDLPGYIVSAGKAGAVSSETECERLVSCLERNLWSVPRAARELGVHRTTLWRKMKRLNIEKP